MKTRKLCTDTLLQKAQDKPGLLESCLKIKEVMMWKRTGTQAFTLEGAPKHIATYVIEQQ